MKAPVKVLSVIIVSIFSFSIIKKILRFINRKKRMAKLA